MSLSKLNEEEIATITFKYRTAQRRFEDGTIWDRLKQESPVYNGDTIRTADYSEATLHFIDGNEMSLADNTMTQVFLNENKQLKALLSNGSVTIDTTNAQEDSNGFSLSFEGVEIQVENGSSLNAQGASGNRGFAVQVYEGNAKITDIDGKINTMQRGDTMSVDQRGNPVPTISITKPTPNAKVINHTKDSINVNIEWKLINIEGNVNTTLEISSDISFKKVEELASVTNKNSYTATLSTGQKYYRITARDTTGKEIAKTIGKIQIIESLIPRQISPVNEYCFYYRKQLPVIRFLWSESKFATSYELVIANNERMINPIITQRTALPSSIVSNLPQGKWYWRVTPFYTINNLGLDGQSEVSMFEINQQGDLIPPELIYPADNAFVNTKNASKKINYSWKFDRESVAYDFVIADNPDLKNPKYSFKTDVNYYPFNTVTSGIANGTWYWGIRSIDNEGNKSEFSKSRKFYAVDGEIIQRTVYPPNHYSVAKNLLSDLRFTWKSNIPFDTRFEIAKDESFNQIVQKQFIHDSTTSGINLAVGTYYWRIVSSSPDRDFTSSVKELNVLGPLEAPDCLIPDINKKALVRPFTPFDFTWTSVDGANYYKLTIKNPRSKEVIFEQNLIEDTKLSINMEDMAEGLYEWSIQSFSYETDLQSRRTGKSDEAKFELKKIHPVKLLSPEDGIIVNGVDAILKPSSVTWISQDEISSSEFVLTRTDLKPAEIVVSQKNPEKTISLPRLHSGTYTWTVNAESTDGFDLSPLTPYTMTITPVPPLESATKLIPENRTKFGVDYFKTTKSIKFSWARVKDATHYIVRIHSKDGKLLFEKRVSETNTEFTDIKQLSRGNFTWSVEAIRCISDGTILQESKPAKNTFIIDLPELKATKLKEGLMYGK